MKNSLVGGVFISLAVLLCCLVEFSCGAELEKKNKFRDRQATDDTAGYAELDEDSLLNTKCPKNLELRWQTEVSSSIYATPLIADINGDGKLDIVVPSFVHYLDVLEGSDGDKMPGWPAFHQSTVHSSPLLYDIDKDGVREIALATYNGRILFFRVSGYLMNDKLDVPRRRVKKNWYVGLNPDPVDRSHPDVHDDQLLLEEAQKKSQTTLNVSHGNETSQSQSASESSTSNSSVPASMLSSNLSSTNSSAHDANMNASTAGTNVNLTHVVDNSSIVVESVSVKNSSGMRRLMEVNTEGDPKGNLSGMNTDDSSTMHTATVANEEALEADADSSFELLRDNDELGSEYSYDYDDNNEEAWGDEEWTEKQHEKLEDFVDIDSHILCTPVIADIDNDGISEMIVAVSHFFDREYYENPEHKKDLGDIDIGKYIAGSIVVFNLDTKQIKWIKELDISTESSDYRAYLYSSPTVIDLDGDGNLDILFGTSFGLFYVLDHHGNVRENFPLQMAEIHAAVIAGDINDDGKIELVTTDTHGNVAAWTSQGKEIWEVHVKSLVSQAPTIGDVDGDGHTEVVVPTLSGNIFVLSGKDGSTVRPFPFKTHGRVMNQILLMDLNKRGTNSKGLTLVTTSFDGYLYLIDGATSCADVVDIGETSYSMVLADNVDGGDDLDLVVATMNGNVFCFSTQAPHHPLKAWRSTNQGRNNFAIGVHRQGICVTPQSRAFRDEEGKTFWVEIEILDNYRYPSASQAPYHVSITLLVPGNYQGQRRITKNQTYNRPGKYKISLPTVPVRTAGAVLVEMVDKNGIYFSDEFSLTFHMHYYKLLKWLIALPMLAMFSVLAILQPPETRPLPSFSRHRDL